MLLLGVLLVPAGVHAQAPACVPSEEALGALIRAHVARYPALEVQDLYKLLHQASLGSEHAVADTAAARDWMQREIADLGDGPPEPLVDTLGAGGGYARVHLRPYLAAGGQPERLLAAFVQTATQAPAEAEGLTCARAVALRLARAGTLPWPEATIARFFSAQERARDPAVHHSVVFEARYRPAYRVVARGLLGTLSLPSE